MQVCAGRDVEVPAQAAGRRVDPVEAALAENRIVDVHAEDERVAADHDRRRLDLVALVGVRAAARRVAVRVDAAGAGREAPQLGAGHRVERVDDLARAHEDAVAIADARDVDRAALRERGARLIVGGEAPELAAIREPHRVDVAVPGLEVDDLDHALAGHEHGGHAWASR